MKIDFDIKSSLNNKKYVGLKISFIHLVTINELEDIELELLNIIEQISKYRKQHQRED